MKKILIGLAVLIVVGLGIYSISHKSQNLEGSPVETNSPWFYNGFSAGQQSTTGNSGSNFGVSSTGAMTSATITASSLLTITDFNTATVGSSSSTPAALGSSVAGFFTATTTTQSASTTSVTANSTILLTPVLTVPTAGVTCAQGAPATTTISSVIPGNGFIIKMSSAPGGATTPFCYNYFIVN